MNTVSENVIELILTEQDIRDRQKEYADLLGVSVEEVYRMLDAEDDRLRGTIMAAKLSSLRFLLDGTVKA